MKMTENVLKKWSTWANGVTLVLGAAMVYLPQLVPQEYNALVMCACSVTVAVCQFIKQCNLEKLADED